MNLHYGSNGCRKPFVAYNFSRYCGAMECLSVSRCKGGNSRFKLHGLFICHLATSLVNVILMDGATNSDVVKAIATFSANKRLPQNVVKDAGPQLKNFEGNPLFNGISESGITIKPVGANNQFLNFAEWQVQVWKKLLSSMSQEVQKSVYDQKQTTIQLQAKLSLCE